MLFYKSDRVLVCSLFVLCSFLPYIHASCTDDGHTLIQDLRRSGGKVRSRKITRRAESLKVEKEEQTQPDDELLLIETIKGKVRGFTATTPTGKKVDLWLGIPFAQAPLGELRFLPPRPVESWINVLNTTTPANSCVQQIDTDDHPASQEWNPTTPLSEDCLYLNVAVPKPRQSKLPVMVWIHGGGFYSGSSTLGLYDLRTLASEENIIAISIQYRVASLGFLYSGTPEAPGNAGMLDQVAALQWVHDNIEKFGGDPERVTIFGESAGGASTSYLLLSPLSRDLFQRAIVQSGSARCPWAFVDKDLAVKRALILAKAVDCPHDPDRVSEAVDCLRTKDAKELIEKDWDSPLRLGDFPFAPIADGNFLEDTPENLLRDGKFKRTDVLLGATENEGTMFMYDFIGEPFVDTENITLTREDFLKFIKQSYPELDGASLEAVEFEYTNWENPGDSASYIESLDKAFGDRLLTCGVVEDADRHADAGNNVYLYVYNHRSSLDLFPKWMGVEHAAEIKFVFGEPLNPEIPYTEEDRDFGRDMMRLWSNFARNGNPYSEDMTRLPEWPLYNTNDRQYMDLRGGSSRVLRQLRTRQCRFWSEYLPKLVEQTTC